MGQEVKTTLRWDGRIIEGTALLESEALVFRGSASLNIPFKEMFAVEANSGWLEIKSARGLMLIELGPKAETWAEKIKNPKALVEKLGVDATKKIAALGKLDADLRADIEGTGAKIAKTAKAAAAFDLVFVSAANKKEIEKVPAAKELVKDDGGIWIVYPKGSADLTEREVLTAGRTLGLTDNKQVKVSDTLTSVRFVIPVAHRGKKRA